MRVGGPSHEYRDTRYRGGPLVLTTDALRSALKRVTYWNYRMVLYQHASAGIWMSIKGELPDAENPGKTTVVNIRTAVPPMVHETAFFQWLDWRLNRVAAHEHREGFRVDGKKWIDPHAHQTPTNSADTPTPENRCLRRCTPVQLSAGTGRSPSVNLHADTQLTTPCLSSQLNSGDVGRSFIGYLC